MCDTRTLLTRNNAVNVSLTCMRVRAGVCVLVRGFVSLICPRENSCLMLWPSAIRTETVTTI